MEAGEQIITILMGTLGIIIAGFGFAGALIQEDRNTKKGLILFILFVIGVIILMWAIVMLQL
tara:strand:- start:226 stop:411 length:186 start_codon:yes stop_codon:yes gene_type:complete